MWYDELHKIKLSRKYAKIIRNYINYKNLKLKIYDFLIYGVKMEFMLIFISKILI